MKTIRSLTTLVGLSFALFALGAIGARAQALTSTEFAGTFTLSHETQWGGMTLPAGDYNLYYGRRSDGIPEVDVFGKADGSPHGWVFGRPADPSSATKNSLICIRDGNSLVVRKLELAVIGEAVRFPMPHGVKLVAHGKKHGKYMLAEAPMLIERVPVILNEK